MKRMGGSPSASPTFKALLDAGSLEADPVPAFCAMHPRHKHTASKTASSIVAVFIVLSSREPFLRNMPAVLDYVIKTAFCQCAGGKLAHSAI
jgi:hypothetical protein